MKIKLADYKISTVLPHNASRKIWTKIRFFFLLRLVFSIKNTINQIIYFFIYSFKMQTTSIKTIYKSYESLIGSKIIVNGWFISKKSSDRFWTRTWKFQWSRKIRNREQPSDWRRSHKIRMSKTSFWTQSYKNNAFRSSRWNIPTPKKETLFRISQNYRTPQTKNKHVFCSIQSKKSAFFRYS